MTNVQFMHLYRLLLITYHYIVIVLCLVYNLSYTQGIKRLQAVSRGKISLKNLSPSFVGCGTILSAFEIKSGLIFDRL